MSVLVDFATNRKTLDGAQQAIEAALAIFECTQPAYGVPGRAHCAACCYGTGYVITCEEEDELVRALSDALSALRKYARGDA